MMMMCLWLEISLVCVLRLEKEKRTQSPENVKDFETMRLVARYHKIVTNDDANCTTTTKKKVCSILIEKMTKPKILCLHGANSNNDITQIQLYGLGLTNLAECECLNGRLTANNILKQKNNVDSFARFNLILPSSFFHTRIRKIFSSTYI